MQTVDAHVGRMEADLARWAAKLDELRARGDTSPSQVNLDYHKRLDDLEERYEAAQTKLDELKAAGSAKWETHKNGIEDAWSDLEAAFRKLAN